MKNYYIQIIDKINNKKAKVAIVGLGYVGWPLYKLIKKKKFDVIGIDKKFDNKKKNLSSDYSNLNSVDIVIFCLPTPLDKKNKPDLKILKKALIDFVPYSRKGQILIVESTSYPGTTNECTVKFQKKFKVGEEFFISYSPERIDPGNKIFKLFEIPKIISGKTEKCKKILNIFYKNIFKVTYLSSCMEVAEMTKIYENIFRSVNIGLVNEIKQISKKLKIDFIEVLNLAETKPFGFMKFLPGPGVGGHCIPVDPFYLNWIARKKGIHSKFIELSGLINRNIPNIIIREILKLLKKNKSKILCLGLAYKKNIEDVRNSPALEIFKKLHQKKFFNVYYEDRYVPEIKLGKIVYKSVKKANYKNYDCVIILTDHDYINFTKLINESKMLIDCRNRIRHKKVINL